MQKTKIALLAFLFLFVVGCGHLAPDGVYKGDTFLYNADNTITVSFEVFHSFVKWEKANRTIFASHTEIKTSADYIRKNAKRWRASYVALRSAYVANPTQANKDALTTAIQVIQSALTEATQYFATTIE